MPLILSGNVASAIGGAYEVANSCRFDGSSAYMTKTPGSAGSQVTQTYSVWVKRSKLGDEEFIMYARKDADDDTRLYFEDDTLRFQCTVNNTTHTRLWTNRVFRDPSAWYHIVISYDSSVSTPSTSSIQMFINGVKETSFSSATYPSQNEVSYWCDDALHTIGRRSDGTSNYYNGYMAEAVLIDGSALTASSFGEFDEDSPNIWKPKDVSGLTFGTNGFYLDFEASDNLGNDANGGTDFSESGLAAADQATDTPTNNFAVANPLQAHADTTFAEGNTWTRQLSSATAKMYAVSTIGMSAGKWYMEFKNVTNDNDSLYGITTNPNSDHVNNYYPGEQAHSFGFYGSDGNKYTGGSGSSYGSAASSNDIIGVALDITNENLYFSINGTWQNSGDPTSGATGTGAIDISGIGAGDGFYYFSAGSIDTSNYDNPYYNFGNPAFSISSSQADDNGYGNFEYDVPAGYLALCTKNLGSDGG